MSKIITITIVPEELAALRDRVERIFGVERLAAKVAFFFGVNQSTVHNWLSGESRMPGAVRTSLDMLEVMDKPTLPDRFREALALKDERKSA